MVEVVYFNGITLETIEVDEFEDLVSEGIHAARRFNRCWFNRPWFEGFKVTINVWNDIQIYDGNVTEMIQQVAIVYLAIECSTNMNGASGVTTITVNEDLVVSTGLGVVRIILWGDEEENI